jgi:hypothetical protein
MPNQGSGSPQILCPNLIEFRQVVVSEHLWYPPDRISSWAAQLLFGQVGLINAHSQLPARILSNSGKEFEEILIPKSMLRLPPDKPAPIPMPLPHRIHRVQRDSFCLRQEKCNKNGHNRDPAGIEQESAEFEVA